MRVSLTMQLAGLVAGLAGAGAGWAQETTPASEGEGPVPPAEVAGFAGQYALLEALADAPGPVALEGYGQVFYVPSTVDTVVWGYLPNRESEPVLTVPSGSTVVFDAVSHEGILEDQGRDPVAYFSRYGVGAEFVLEDAQAIAASEIEHDFAADGPHVVTGPVAIEGAEPGDVLMVETLDLMPRAPYGVISNRHGKGALPGEFPETAEPDPAASADQPELYRNVSIFTPVRKFRDGWYGVLHNREMEEVLFPLNPFMGVMGIAADTGEPVHSVPPDVYGGNLDVNELGVGSTLYLPVQVPGALFYTGDPHSAQGDGEVALTALELPMRAVFRLTLLKNGDPRIPSAETLATPFGETADYWIPIGLDEDLDEAMKNAVRLAVDFLSDKLDMDRATALAYMSAATDYEVSQVVDRTKGVHALISKQDFGGTAAAAELGSARAAGAETSGGGADEN